MVRVTPLVLRQIYQLDRSSSDFQDKLVETFRGQEYTQCMQNLQSDNLRLFVDYLDEVLEVLDPSCAASRKCLRELRTICGTMGMLPTSYMKLPLDDLKIGPVPFALGGFSDVYKATLGDLTVCAKRIRVYGNDSRVAAAEIFCREAVTWKYLRHPHVLPFLGVTLAPLQLISVWMPGEDLSAYVKANPDVNRLDLLRDVASGLDYLHSRNVIHGDIKGCKILVDIIGDSPRALIGGFGVSLISKNPHSARLATREDVHSPRWAAPEVLAEAGPSKKSDVYSFAMVIIEVFTGQPPFNNQSNYPVVPSILRGDRPPKPPHPDYTEALWALTQRCWDPDPNSRPETPEVLHAILTLELPSWRLLTGHTGPVDERISLIKTIFSNRDMVRALSNELFGKDAQAIVDVIDSELNGLPQEIRRSCAHYLHRICGRRTLLPKSLTIPLLHNPTDTPLYQGGFAVVFKDEYCGREVAVKVLKVSLTSNFDKIKKRFCKEVVGWRTLRHPNVLPLLGVTMAEKQFVMVSGWMQNGDITRFVKVNRDVNRLELLKDVTRGLMYMHDEGIVHGDLKGANILIGDDGRACIADFSLLTVIPDQETLLSTCVVSGTLPWMSPELLDPEAYGFERPRLTKESDRYALGMVVFEVLSGQRPFEPVSHATVVHILRGKRPEKPKGVQGAFFTDRIWEVLQLCWKSVPKERPGLEMVLQCLGGDTQPSAKAEENIGEDSDTQSDENTSGHYCTSTSKEPRPVTSRSNSGLLGPSSRNLGVPIIPMPQEGNIPLNLLPNRPGTPSPAMHVNSGQVLYPPLSRPKSPNTTQDETDESNLFIDPMMGSPLEIYVDEEVQDRNAVVNLINSHGGTVSPHYDDVSHILVDPYHENGQRLYRRCAGKKGKVVLDVKWARKCIEAGTLQTYGTNWAGYKVTGAETTVGQSA